MKSWVVLFALVAVTTVGCGSSVTGPADDSNSESTSLEPPQMRLGGDYIDEDENQNSTG